MSLLSAFKTVFILAPHTDDGELGAGGTIAKLIELGADVHYFAFSSAQESVKNGFDPNILREEVKNATRLLGIPEENVYIYDYKVRKLNYSRQEILEDLIALKNRFNPDLILMPSLNDIHQDHETIAREGLRAFKYSTILGYELIWNNLTFNSSAFVELNEGHLSAKIKALKEYKSQASRDYMSAEFISSLAMIRGVQIGVKLAESFEVVRWRLL
jgi:LmbE family N-acetylglucosaminyl deacetylase